MIPGLPHATYSDTKSTLDSIKFKYRGMRDENGEYPNMLCEDEDLELPRRERVDTFKFFESFSSDFQDFLRTKWSKLRIILYVSEATMTLTMKFWYVISKIFEVMNNSQGNFFLFISFLFLVSALISSSRKKQEHLLVSRHDSRKSTWTPLHKKFWKWCSIDPWDSSIYDLWFFTGGVGWLM